MVLVYFRGQSNHVKRWSPSFHKKICRSIEAFLFEGFHCSCISISGSAQAVAHLEPVPDAQASAEEPLTKNWRFHDSKKLVEYFECLKITCVQCPKDPKDPRLQCNGRRTGWLHGKEQSANSDGRILDRIVPQCQAMIKMHVRLLFIYCLDFRCAKSLATVDLLCIEKADTFRKISILTWWWWWWWWSWWWNGEARKTLRRCCAVLQCFHSHSAQDDRSWADLPQAMKREDPFAGMVRCGRKLLKQRYLETSLCECHKSLW